MKKLLSVLLLTLVLAASVIAYAWFHTDIPKLYLDGDISAMESKEDVRYITFRYEDDSTVAEGFAKIKVQGTSSLAYEKKNYTLNFYSDEEYEDKLKLDVGWGPQNKYCMKANWIDRTHARNVVSAKLAGQMQSAYGLLTEAPNNGAVDGFPVEIYNNGNFLGLYTFNIPKDAWQFAMDEDNPDHIVIGGEGWEPASRFRGEPNFSDWAVEVGEESEQTLEKMKRMFDFVQNSTDEDFGNHFSEYLNLDSALNYYIFSDIAYLKDNLAKNMLIATYDGMEWYLSLYDLDSSWGTETNGESLMEYQEQLLDFSASRLFERMETCFAEELAERFFELREDILSNENILRQFRYFDEQIPALTRAKEILRWGSGFLKKHEDLPGYDYDQIEAYLDSVSDRLDQKYTAMRAG